MKKSGKEKGKKNSEAKKRFWSKYDIKNPSQVKYEGDAEFTHFFSTRVLLLPTLSSPSYFGSPTRRRNTAITWVFVLLNHRYLGYNLNFR